MKSDISIINNSEILIVTDNNSTQINIIKEDEDNENIFINDTEYDIIDEHIHFLKKNEIDINKKIANKIVTKIIEDVLDESKDDLDVSKDESKNELDEDESEDEDDLDKDDLDKDDLDKDESIDDLDKDDLDKDDLDKDEHVEYYVEGHVEDVFKSKAENDIVDVDDVYFGRGGSYGL